tara:strand:+ start:273 stop:410 length:138 start_codon:yes stop_codon:yes gene_type:complete
MSLVLSILAFFLAGVFTGILVLFSLVMWYCRDGGAITIKGEDDGR